MSIKKHADAKNCVTVSRLAQVLLKTSNYSTRLFCINRYHEVLKALFKCFKNWNCIRIKQIIYFLSFKIKMVTIEPLLKKVNCEYMFW